MPIVKCAHCPKRFGDLETAIDHVDLTHEPPNDEQN